MSNRTEITHVIYDMDGVLLNTEPFYTQAWRALCDEYGVEFTWDLKSQMVGRPSPDVARMMVGVLNCPLTAEELLERRDAMQEDLFPTTEAMPGAVELTRHLHAHGVPQAVASSSRQHPYNLKTTLHREWFTIFNCIVLGDDPRVRAGKPSPDIFLLAAESIDATPGQCLVFEDAPAGVAAARAAGMSVIAVPDPNMPQHLYVDADAVLGSLFEFDPRAWGLPPLPATPRQRAI